MKFLEKCKDGGSKSNVDAYFVCEIKNLFSIAFLKFNKGAREEYHSHAFNARTWFLKGELFENEIINGGIVEKQYKRSILPKLTPISNLHRVVAKEDSWCFTIRGKWVDTWFEVSNDLKTKTTFTHGRKVIKTESYN